MNAGLKGMEKIVVFYQELLLKQIIEVNGEKNLEKNVVLLKDIHILNIMKKYHMILNVGLMNLVINAVQIQILLFMILLKMVNGVMKTMNYVV